MKTEAKIENENIKASENTLTELLNDFSIDAVIAIDINHNIIAWNRTAAVFYGHSKKEATGRSIFMLIPGLREDKESVHAIEQALKGYKTFVPASKQHAHRTHSENHYIPLKDNDGNIIGVMNIVHDVAHRIKAEQQLQYLNEELEKRYRQLQATSQELATFTYITSNKIKEPIRQVYTGIEHLITVEASRLSNSGKATFRRMQTSLTRMDLLLDDILSVAQISILERSYTPVDLTSLAKEVRADVERKTDKRPIIHIHELCVINGHHNYLYRLFYSLLQNAVKFNESPQPVVDVSCEKTVLENSSASLSVEYYKVTITDNGIGFEDADKNRIFTVFEKLHGNKYKGSGIGLTMAKKIMDAHDGFITAESIPGQGSSFHCYFPVSF
jgi:PAS domain S-box-containing protein